MAKRKLKAKTKIVIKTAKSLKEIKAQNTVNK